MNGAIDSASSLAQLKVPPHSIDAEQSVLGALMLDNAALDEVRGILQSGDFYRPQHQIIYQAILTVVTSGQRADVITVHEAANDPNVPLDYLGELVSQTPSSANVAAYARIVKDKATQRALIQIGGQIEGLAYNPDGRTVPDVLDESRRLLVEIGEGGVPKSRLRTVQASSYAGKPIPERRWTVQDWIPGGHVTGLGGPGGAAKSLLGQQLATHYTAGVEFLGCAVEKRPALFLSCEDDEEELHRRQHFINAAMGLDWEDLSYLHHVSRVGEDSYLATVQDGIVERMPFFESLSERMGDLRIGLLVLDVIPDFWNGNENDRQQVNRFVKYHLAHLAKEHEAAVLALYHPSRAGMQTDGQSGSTAWDGSFRSRLYLSVPQSDGKPDLESNDRTLARLKANYAAKAEVELTWRDSYLWQKGGTSTQDERLERWKTAFLTCLEWCNDNDTPVSPTYNSGHYYGKRFPDLFREIDRRHGRVTRKQFENAYTPLLYDKAIKVVSDPRQRAGDRLEFVGYGRS